MKSTALFLAMLLSMALASAQANSPLQPAAPGTGVQGGSAPIETALTTIVPAPYHLKIDDAIPKNTVLTWNSGRDWMTALQQAAKGSNLRVIPQWDNNTIFVAAAAGAGASAKPVEAAAASAASTPATATTTPVQSSGTEAAVTDRTWSVETRDVNLANTFQRWAAVAGWRVRWDAAKHVMVEAPDSVSGTFEDAVTAQLSSPGIAHSAYPLEVCFYPNHPPLARITRKGDQAKECK